MERVPVYVADLEALRFLVTVGWLLLAGWWVMQLRAERPDRPRHTYERCNLHSVDI